ncbi:hypothetical protein [Halorubrum sp. HHNYT27]|uniref:hypothetical protein n=1 Tax=Halorubrum sp. HHNYT27 TaxID=3402275 RepID=UPI003EBF5010
MRLRRLPATRAAAARYAGELWLPYHRDLAERVDGHVLADRPKGELIAEETAFRLDRPTDGARDARRPRAADTSRELIETHAPPASGAPAPPLPRL